MLSEHRTTDTPEEAFRRGLEYGNRLGKTWFVLDPNCPKEWL